jgi:hypothetical protein
MQIEPVKLSNITINISETGDPRVTIQSVKPRGQVSMVLFSNPEESDTIDEKG